MEEYRIQWIFVIRYYSLFKANFAQKWYEQLDRESWLIDLSNARRK